MIKGYKEGFSLAEALIALVIISLVMAATMPIVLKSKSAPSEAPWKYVTQGDLSQNAAVYTVLGETSSALFGDKRVPIDSNVSTNKDYVFATKINPKLSIIARNRIANPIISRHLLDFYERETNGNYTSIGKVSFDQFYNLSLGLNAMDAIKSTTAEPQVISLDAASDTDGYDWSDIKFTTGNFDTTATRGAANTAIGQYSMAGNSRYLKATGTEGAYVDYPTRNITGVGNTALGAFSMRRLQTGHFNTAIGTYALQSSSKSAAGTVYASADIGSGSYNTGVGAYALKYNSTGSLNTTVGTFSMRNNSTGQQNTSLGYAALYSNTTGSNNTSLGHNTMTANTTGTRNVAIGSRSMIANTEGWNNIAIGYQALQTNTTGTGNIAIGNSSANGITATTSNKLYIGGKTETNGNATWTGTDSLIYGDMATQNLTFNTKTLTSGIDNTSQTYLKGTAYIQRTDASGHTTTNYKIATIADIQSFLNNTHGPTAGGGKVTYTTPNDNLLYSDIRLKNVIGNNTAGLKEIMQIQVKNYTMKRDKKKEVLVGVIAQELQKVFPNSVVEGRDGYLRIRRDEIFYACLNAIKELNNMFKDMAAKITGLDEKIRILEDRNKMNETKITELERQNKIFEERLNALETKKSKKSDTVEQTTPQENVKDTEVK